MATFTIDTTTNVAPPIITLENDNVCLHVVNLTVEVPAGQSRYVIIGYKGLATRGPTVSEEIFVDTNYTMLLDEAYTGGDPALNVNYSQCTFSLSLANGLPVSYVKFISRLHQLNISC